MFTVVTDSSAMYSGKQAEEAGFYALPLFVLADEQSYRDFEEIDADRFASLTRQARSLKTSQPSIGEKIDVYEQILETEGMEVLDLTISDHLSGTYQAACSAKMACSDPNRVHVFNTETLCGPHQKMVEYALARAKEGADVKDVLSDLEAAKAESASTLCVMDIAHLVRGGRLSKTAGAAGKILKLMPVAAIGEDGKLALQGTARTWKKAFDIQKRFLVSKGMNEHWTLYLSHGNNPQAAEKARAYFLEAFPAMDIVIQPLNAMFMVHGGEGCLAIQAIRLDVPKRDALALLPENRPAAAAALL